MPYVRQVARTRWPRPRYPHREVLIYQRKIRYFCQQAEYIIRRDIFPALPRLLGEASRVPVPTVLRRDAADDIDDAIASAAAATARAIPDADVEAAARQTAVRMSEWQADELGRQVQKVTKVNLYDGSTGLEQHLDLFVTDNVSLIKSIPADQLADVKGVITRGARAGKHHTEVAAEIAAKFGVSRKRAALIASDQIGKLNGELNQIRQQGLGVRRYRWSSVQDQRVRERHKVLNGSIQEWAVPPIVDTQTMERGHPGQPIRCRCVAIPIVDDVFADAGLIDPGDVETTHPTAGEQPGLQSPPQRVPSIPPANVPAPTYRPPPAPTPPTAPPADPPVGQRAPVVAPVTAALQRPAANDRELQREIDARMKREVDQAIERVNRLRAERRALARRLAAELDTAAAAAESAAAADALAIAETRASAGYRRATQQFAAAGAAAATMRRKATPGVRRPPPAPKRPKQATRARRKPGLRRS
jgi:SPP1 gp7 family putative phage head morphogenesis protein